MNEIYIDSNKLNVNLAKENTIKNLSYNDLGSMIEKEKIFNDVNDLIYLENFKSILKTLYDSKNLRLTEGKINFIENLKENNNLVDNQEIQLMINNFSTRLKSIPQLLQFENFKNVFFDYTVRLCKNNWKTGYEKTEFFNTFIYEFDKDKSLTLDLEENRKFLKEIFKLSIDNLKASTEVSLIYMMLTKLVFFKKDTLPLDFVKEVCAIHLDNNVFVGHKTYEKKIEEINVWIKSQNLEAYYKENKNLKNIINQNNSTDSICTKFYINYVDIGKEKKAKSIWIRDNYRHACSVLEEKIKDTENISDFFYQEKNNTMTIFLIYEKENDYIKSIKEFFNQYPEGLTKLKSINIEYPEKLLLKLKIEQQLPIKNSNIKKNKI